jgi:hypothetical protein
MKVIKDVETLMFSMAVASSNYLLSSIVLNKAGRRRIKTNMIAYTKKLHGVLRNYELR